MGVISCDVKGCKNVMCSRFSWKLQKDICNDCYQRLLTKGILNSTGIKEFFDTEPEEAEILVDADKYYSEIFVMRDY